MSDLSLGAILILSYLVFAALCMMLGYAAAFRSPTTRGRLFYALCGVATAIYPLVILFNAASW